MGISPSVFPNSPSPFLFSWPLPLGPSQYAAWKKTELIIVRGQIGFEQHHLHKCGILPYIWLDKFGCVEPLAVVSPVHVPWNGILFESIPGGDKTWCKGHYMMSCYMFGEVYIEMNIHR